MSRSFWSMFIGYLSAIVYTCLTVYLFTGLIGLHNIGNGGVKAEEHKEIDPDLIDMSTDIKLTKFTRKQIAVFTIKLICDIVMMICSVLLIVGVKQERHCLMAPWVFISGFSVFVILVSFMAGGQSTGSYVLDIVAFVIGLAVWYPVFKHYRSIKKSHCGHKSIESPSDKCMMNPPTAPLYAHVNAYPCAPPASEFDHCTPAAETSCTHETQ